MKRLLAPAIISAAALAVAACGTDDGDSGSAAAANAVSASAPDSASASDSPASSAGSTPTVSVTEIEEFGPVLTDAEGQVLYVSDEEAADPAVVCTDACEEFWAPAEAGSEAPTGAEGVTGLDVFERPDGSMQVTHEGLRLYTFTLDESGEATGEGLSDTFDDQRFTWHVALVDETAATGSADSTASAVPADSTPAAAGSSATSGATTTAPSAGDNYDYGY
jgi:predicted lipoprotein with Yx(FWY)xxD motif